MRAHTLLAICRARGVQLIPDGDRIVLRGPKDARDELRPEIAAHKPELLAVLKSDAGPKPVSEGTRCDDCGREVRIALVTSYGSRYCCECVFPSITAPKAQRGTQ